MRSVQPSRGDVAYPCRRRAREGVTKGRGVVHLARVANPARTSLGFHPRGDPFPAKLAFELLHEILSIASSNSADRMG
jgi:hypothetical protein